MISGGIVFASILPPSTGTCDASSLPQLVVILTGAKISGVWRVSSTVTGLVVLN